LPRPALATAPSFLPLGAQPASLGGAVTGKRGKQIVGRSGPGDGGDQ